MTNYKVSLIIPVRNEEGTVLRLLESIRHQTRRPDEILFVDGGSRDRTVSLLRSGSSHALSIRVIEAGNAYPGRGRNIGVQSSRFSLMAFTDAGIHLHPQWLESLVDPVEKDPTIDVVFGSYEPVTDSFYRKCASYIIAGPYTIIGGKRIRTFSMTSMVMKKKVWDGVGGQREDLRSAEDLIFIQKVLSAGFHINYAPDALVYWNLPSDLRDTFRKFILYSASNVKAGLASQWHYGVLRNYIIAACFLLAGIFVSPWGYVLLSAFFLARAGKYIYQGERPRRWSTVCHIRRLVTVLVIMVSIDFATLLGLVKWYYEISNIRGRRDDS